MERRFNIIRTSEDYHSPLRRRLCVDIETAKEIRDYLYSNNKKFLQIAERLLTLSNIYYDHYKQEYKQGKYIVSAIRFLDKQNVRIYCQEMSDSEGDFFIICSEIISKKVQKNDKAINDILESISNYEYEYKP